MNRKYIFIFGFGTPQQFANNLSTGWDDEDSMSVCIIAESEEQAFTWGREVAEYYVNGLFRGSDVNDFSWKEHNYAHWIESDPSRLVSESAIPILKVGEYLPNN